MTAEAILAPEAPSRFQAWKERTDAWATRMKEKLWVQRLLNHGPIVALVAVAAGLRGFRVGDCGGALIGDEVWYVQAARVIARVPVLMHHLPAEAKSGLDPNSEHPPLAKAIIAGMIGLMGDKELAWRIPSVILGTLAVFLIYRIVLTLGGKEARPVAVFAAFIVTFENLFLVHGRIATLDIYLMTGMMLGTWIYLLGYLEVAAVVFAVTALCKVNAVAGLASLIFFEAVMARSQWRHPSGRAIGRRVLVVGIFVSAFLLGLGTLDCFFTEYRTPFAHLAHMGSYHAGFKHTGPSTGAESTPLDWWLNNGGFDYYMLTSPHKHLLYRAAMNAYVIAAAPLGIAYAVRELWRTRSPVATFAVAWVLGNFTPVFLAWLIMSRTSYIYYMLPLIPGFACALALLAYAGPRSLRWVFVVMIFYGFLFTYPVRFY